MEPKSHTLPIMMYDHENHNHIIVDNSKLNTTLSNRPCCCLIGVSLNLLANFQIVFHISP